MVESPNLIQDRIEDWWSRVQWRSPHSPEAIAMREEHRRRMAAEPKKLSYEQRLRERSRNKHK